MQRPTILLVLAAGALGAQGEIIQSFVELNGSQSVPSTGSPGVGFATVIVDTQTRDIQITGEFSGLLGLVFAAHIHGPADVGVNSPIVIHPLELVLSEDRHSGTFTLDDRLTRGQLDIFLDSRTYLNIHSSEFRDGEIRGQVVVPAPGALATIALGGLVATRRRR